MRGCIANVDAHTYRQLVDAAESCRIGVIHPGKPRNKNEPAGWVERKRNPSCFNRSINRIFSRRGHGVAAQAVATAFPRDGLR
jgi:hypothetical protein